MGDNQRTRPAVVLMIVSLGVVLSSLDLADPGFANWIDPRHKPLRRVLAVGGRTAAVEPSHNRARPPRGPTA